MFWKIYCWFIIIFMSLGYLTGQIRGLIGVIDLVLSSLMFLGLYLYSYKKYLFTTLFWRIYFFVYIAWDLSYNFYVIPNYYHESWNLFAIIIYLLVIPTYVSVFLYAFQFRSLHKQTI